MQRQTPNQKVFLLFLEFESKTGKKITADNIDEAIQYVLKNYNDRDIPTQSELRQLARQLVLRYMQIPLLRRTRDVLKNTYGRALANFEKPKALTEAGKEVQKKKQQDLMARASSTFGASPAAALVVRASNFGPAPASNFGPAPASAVGAAGWYTQEWQSVVRKILYQFDNDLDEAVKNGWISEDKYNRMRLTYDTSTWKVAIGLITCNYKNPHQLTQEDILLSILNYLIGRSNQSLMRGHNPQNLPLTPYMNTFVPEGGVTLERKKQLENMVAAIRAWTPRTLRVMEMPDFPLLPCPLPSLVPVGTPTPSLDTPECCICNEVITPEEAMNKDEGIAFCPRCLAMTHVNCYCLNRQIRKTCPNCRQTLDWYRYVPSTTDMEAAAVFYAKYQKEQEELNARFAASRAASGAAFGAAFSAASGASRCGSSQTKINEDREIIASIENDYIKSLRIDEEQAVEEQSPTPPPTPSEMRLMRLAAFNEYKKHAHADMAAEMAMHARKDAPLFTSLQRQPPVSAAAAAAAAQPLRDDALRALTDEDIDRMFGTPPVPHFPLRRFYQAQDSHQQPSVLDLEFATSQDALDEVMQQQRKKNEKDRKGGKQNKYSKKKYIKRHSKKRHSKKRPKSMK